MFFSRKSGVLSLEDLDRRLRIVEAAIADVEAKGDGGTQPAAVRRGAGGLEAALARYAQAAGLEVRQSR